MCFSWLSEETSCFSQGSGHVGYDTMSSGGGRTVWYQTHNDKASQPRRPESSTTPLWEPEISPNCYFPKQLPDCVFFFGKCSSRCWNWTFEYWRRSRFILLMNVVFIYLLLVAHLANKSAFPSPRSHWDFVSTDPHFHLNRCSVTFVHKPKISFLHFCMHFMLLKPGCLSRCTD